MISHMILFRGIGFKLKRNEVKPNGCLSLWSHKHRSENWVLVSSKALVTDEDELNELAVNQSACIPLGNKYRLKSPGTEQLILTEVQCGSCLGEDGMSCLTCIETKLLSLSMSELRLN